MSCYFMVDVYIDENKGRGAYSDYIEKVKPIVDVGRRIDSGGYGGLFTA